MFFFFRLFVFGILLSSSVYDIGEQLFHLCTFTKCNDKIRSLQLNQKQNVCELLWNKNNNKINIQIQIESFDDDNDGAARCDTLHSST